MEEFRSVIVDGADRLAAAKAKKKIDNVTQL